MASPMALVVLLAFLLSSVHAAPLSSDLLSWLRWPSDTIHLSIDHKGTLPPSINSSFPDPSFLQANSSLWVAFATSGRDKHIQMATAADPLGEWTLLDADALPNDGWTTGENFWAPDVRKLDNGTFIMYFAGRHSEAETHCIGAARADNALGPYTMDPRPFICPVDQGGAIDPMGFKDSSSGRRYVVYKIDGNKENGNKATPLKLQEVEADGTTLIGKAVTIMERDAEQDGPLVEAPNIVRLTNGEYLLFFSSHMFSDAAYDVKYAWAKNIWGPYVRAEEPLLSAPQFNLSGPGGATSDEQGSMLIFHGLCGSGRRCMYAAPYSVNATVRLGTKTP